MRYFIAFFAIATSFADPRISSWYTEHSGAYARIYETIEAEAAQNAVTTWSRGAGNQLEPTYAGIHEVSHTPDWVYIRTTNLASYVMGPWYRNDAKIDLFPNYPANQAALYRFPRNPVDPTSISNKTLTGGGPIGYFVNGVAMFDSRDAFSYNSTNNTDSQGPAGDRAWNRDAYVNESPTFDNANAHQAGSNHHYHANPPALRHQLGDSVDHDPATNSYTENFNTQHSPILAWARDGLPVYGPYGYSDPNDPSSPVRRMISGFQIRSDIASNGSARSTWPAWATRIYAGQRAFATGPNVSNAYPLGRYMEDNDYKGDLGQTLGVDFDLNEYNVRFCVTPEFPQGTYAYFCCIDAVGTPAFPYNIGRSYFGDPIGGPATSIPSADESNAVLTKAFEGGPETPLAITDISLDETASDEITLTWDSIEGGLYQISTHPSPSVSETWTPLGDPTLADSESSTQNYPLSDDTQSFQRVQRINVLPFDDAGFDYSLNDAAPAGDAALITATLDGGPADLNTLPTSLTFNGQAINIASANILRPSQNEISFEAVTTGLAPGDYSVTATFAGQPLRSGNYTLPSSILLLIVDDWGIDASPLHNTLPDALLANMPTLQTLANEGLLFNRAYSQPLCSPMRASMLTGRQPFQHNVGNPQNAGQFSNASDEITLPEIFTSQAAPHALLSVGKWHLGGGESGYSTRGGWPEFYGINSGGVSSFTSWTKNSNGTSSTSTTYSTSDQVNHVVSFVADKRASNTPWFAWVAFNAPHTPFHDPPETLAPDGGYSPQGADENSNRHQYRKALEALDTEIARLLESIDPDQTNIILLGDNGTPGQVVQAPFGNGNAKGDLYNGGIHVPMIAKGPAITLPAGSETETLVHCIDIFATILDLAGIDPDTVPNLAAQNTLSTTMLPLFNGTDTAERYIVSERNPEPGRAVIIGSYPDYKLIINGDPSSTTDTPTFEFFNILTDQNEQNPLDIASLSGDALAAYQACLAKDQALGGGYSDPAQ